jgi:hypothetical protein
MDFVSWLLALIGIGSDRAMHRNDKRAEVARLNAGVAGVVDRYDAVFLENGRHGHREQSILPGRGTAALFASIDAKNPASAD